MEKILALILTSVAIILTFIVYSEAHGNQPAKSDWESYKAFHGKKYHNSTHEGKHRKIFERNARKVAAHNALFKLGLVTFDKELNKFTDEDEATLQQRRGYKQSDNSIRIPEATRRFAPLIRAAALPASFDWRNVSNVNYVSPVKDQGQCGSCWAFSATGALESQAFINNPTTTMKLFSEQQLVDCDTYDDACGGGNFVNAWYYIYENGGIETEASYPYVANVTLNRGTCAYSAAKSAQKVSNFYTLPQNETAIQQFLVSVGPLSIGIDATNLSPYSSGVYNCPSNWSLDHAVLIVGYGTTSTGVDYWIVKNQWGEGWGMKGYFYLRRGTNACGMNSEAAYPKI